MPYPTPNVTQGVLDDSLEVPDPSSFFADEFDAAVRILAAEGHPFEASDVRDLMTTAPTNEHAWGLAYAAARRARIIEPVAYTRATRKARRGGATTLWRGTLAFREGRIA